MPDVLTGKPTNVTTPLSATVTALANNGAGLVRVTTSAPHLFGNGDTVDMSTGVGSGTGRFVISVIDSTHFDLVGSTFVSTSTGTAVDRSITPQILVPTDGDGFSAQLSGLLSAYQAILDRTQYLNNLLLYADARAHLFEVSTAPTGVSTALPFGTPTTITLAQLAIAQPCAVGDTLVVDVEYGISIGGTANCFVTPSLLVGDGGSLNVTVAGNNRYYSVASVTVGTVARFVYKFVTGNAASVNCALVLVSGGSGSVPNCVSPIFMSARLITAGN